MELVTVNPKLCHHTKHFCFGNSCVYFCGQLLNYFKLCLFLLYYIFLQSSLFVLLYFLFTLMRIQRSERKKELSSKRSKRGKNNAHRKLLLNAIFPSLLNVFVFFIFRDAWIGCDSIESFDVKTHYWRIFPSHMLHWLQWLILFKISLS